MKPMSCGRTGVGGCEPQVCLHAALHEMLVDVIRGAVREELKAQANPSIAVETTALRDTVYLTTQKAAELAGVCDETVRNWVRRGELPGHRAGRCLRIRKDEIERFLKAKPAKTEEVTAATIHSKVNKILYGQ